MRNKVCNFCSKLLSIFEAAGRVRAAGVAARMGKYDLAKDIMNNK